MGIRSLISGKWIQEKVRNKEEYKQASAFVDTYKPKGGKDYKWALSHALKEYESADERLNILDAKADSLIWYLGSGSGLISLALLYGISQESTALLLAVLPTLLTLLIATICAAIARSPARIPGLPYTRDALNCIDENGKDAEAKFAAMIATSSVAAQLAANEKARLVRASFWLFILAASWLVGSVTFPHVFGLAASLVSWLAGLVWGVA